LLNMQKQMYRDLHASLRLCGYVCDVCAWGGAYS